MHEPRLYNTLTRRVEPLRAGANGVIGIYVCGPTVYGPIHVGNARPFIVFSILRRHLARQGRRVLLVSNITDINDRIYEAARRAGVPSAELAARFAAEYIADTDRLGLGRPDLEPKATEHLPEIVAMIGRLIDRGLAYPADGDVYFRVDRFPGYGRLSRRRLEDMVAAEPGEAKQHPLDFALWKGHKPDEDTSWPSPWGPGRPGWHIECSAMARAALGPDFAVHGGGLDLVFPHHENEIAQAEGATGEPLARVWAHNEMLELGGKMSKSVGNIVPLREALDRWGREVLLLFMLRTHYRSKLPFAEEGLEDARRQADTIRNGVLALDRALAAPGTGAGAALGEALAAAHRDVVAALDDDLNTPQAFAAVFTLVHAIHRSIDGPDRPGPALLQTARDGLAALLDRLGLASLADARPVPEAVLELARRRETARQAREFAEADRLRDEIAAAGYVVRDTPEGPQVAEA
jgi:cysteinyl-tRNA synthetase